MTVVATNSETEPAAKKLKNAKKKVKKLSNSESNDGENGQEANNKDANKNVVRPKREIVDLFWLVSNEDSKVRQAAISKLSTFSSAEDTSYILKRLVGGLASDRPLARPTFGVGLVSILAKAQQAGEAERMVNGIVEKLGQMEVCGLPKEKRNAALGRISGYLTLVRSGLISSESAHLLPILKDLVELSRVDRTTSKAALKLVHHLVDGYATASSFKEVFWPTLLTAFKGLEGDKGDVEVLTLLLNCAGNYPIAVKKRTKSDLGFKLDFSSISWSCGSVCASFEAAASDLSQPIHSEEAKNLFSAFLTITRDIEGSFERFWTEFVCGKICSSKDKNVLLLKVLDVVFQEPPTKEMLTSVMMRRGLDALSKCHQLGKTNPGRPAADAIINRLVSLISDPVVEEDQKMIVLQAVVKQETGSDASGGGRLAAAVNRLLSAAPDSLLRKVWLLLREELLVEANKKTAVEGEDNRKKRFLWLVKQVQNCVQKSSGKCAWESEALQLLFLFAHFQLPDGVEEASASVPTKCSKSFPEWLTSDWLSSAASTPSLLPNERLKIGEFVFDAILKSTLQESVKIEGVMQLRQFVDGLLSLPPSLLQNQLASSDVESSWREVSSIIASVEKQKSLLPEGQVSPVLDVFQKLFLSMGFQVFTDLDSVRESLPDLRVCAVKGCGLDLAVPEASGEDALATGEADQELKWIDVLTELLMSFLLKENQNYRKLVVSAIPLLLPHFTDKSYQIIKDAAIGKFGGESVFAIEDDDAEEEEGEEDDGDDDSGEDDDEMDAVDQDVEDADEDEDDSDEEDEEAKENTTEDELQVLKMKLASAMGEARPKHLEMDPETDNEESDVDDDEMFKFDDKIAGVFKELESKRQASAEKKANAKKQKLLEESKMKFRLRCLDVLSSLFQHVTDPRVFLRLFDTLVDLEASTRLKAGSALNIKSDFDAKVKHLVKEVAQFRRGGNFASGFSSAESTTTTTTTTSDVAVEIVEKLKVLLKDYLKHASPQSDVSTLCHILVKALLASAKTAPGEEGRQENLKRLVNSAFLDYLDAALAASNKSASSGPTAAIGNNLKFEHFAVFESYVTRFQTEVVDEELLQRLEDVVFRKELSTFSRKHLVAIFNHVLGLVHRGEEGGQEESLKTIFERNLKKCLEAAVEEMGKKETTGIDASSIVSHLSIVLQMHKTKGKLVVSLLNDDHRNALRHLASGMANSGMAKTGNKIAFDSLRRIAMYWGMTKEIQQMGAGKKKKNKNKMTNAVAEEVSKDAEETAMDAETNEKENTEAGGVEQGSKTDDASSVGGGRGKKRKRKLE